MNRELLLIFYSLFTNSWTMSWQRVSWSRVALVMHDDGMYWRDNTVDFFLIIFSPGGNYVYNSLISSSYGRLPRLLVLFVRGISRTGLRKKEEGSTDIQYNSIFDQEYSINSRSFIYHYVFIKNVDSLSSIQFCSVSDKGQRSLEPCRASVGQHYLFQM